MKYTIQDIVSFKSEELENGNILTQDNHEYKFLFEEKVYRINILQRNLETKTMTIKINGYQLNVKSEDQLDLLIKTLGMDKPPKKIIKEILSPMPGLVKHIMVNEGDNIEDGQNLFILEAMKMENIIKSQGEGIVNRILVKVGDKIDKGSILATL
jgi:biotin carboxyl carrier protein